MCTFGSFLVNILPSIHFPWGCRNLSHVSYLFIVRANSERRTTVHTHIHTHGQSRVASQPNVYVSGLGEEYWENPRTHRENIQTVHTEQAQVGIERVTYLL